MLYSEAFRRLGGVTQVIPAVVEAGQHNRLTHSLKVEQVALSIASRLRGTHKGVEIDDGALAAGALAHDLGHPPFGHAGEEELHSLLTCPEHRAREVRTAAERAENRCRDCLLEDGFEGNAQTFRILTATAVHREVAEDRLGMDLARASILAASKYPWPRGGNADKPRKWGAYDCDLPALEWAAGNLPAELTLEAQIMDWADDLTYAIHDLEDFYRAGQIPLDDFVSGSRTREDFFKYVGDALETPISAELLSVFDDLRAFFPTKRFEGDVEDLLHLEGMRSTLLTVGINASQVVDGALEKDAPQGDVNAVVKQMLWFYVIDNPQLASVQAGQRRVLREIFQALVSDAREAYGVGHSSAKGTKAARRLPVGLRHCVEVVRAQNPPTYDLDMCVTRGVVDYIAGMGDAEAYRHHETLLGQRHGIRWGIV